MRLLILLVVLLASAVCFGQAEPIPITSAAGGVMNSDLVTQADSTYYVDPTGNDSNACTASGTSACLTLQGALGKPPKRIRHATTISVAAGTYGCAYISGFRIEYPNNATNGSYLHITGGLSDVTPATGSATGTFESATAGSSSPVVFGTATDSQGTWTVNDLRGKYIVTTGGTGSGQTFVIASNTATVITIVGSWDTQPDATTTFAVRDPNVIINTACSRPATPDNAVSASAGGGLYFAGNASDISGNNAAMSITSVKFTNTTGRGIVLNGPSRIRVLTSTFASTTATGIDAQQNAGLLVRKSVFTPASTSAGISATSSRDTINGLDVTGSAFIGGSVGILVSMSGSRFISTSYFFNNTNAVTTNSGTGESQINDNIIDCNNIASSAGFFTSSTGHWVGYQIGNASISNCTNAYTFTGAIYARLTSVPTGTGNTTAISVVQGAKVKLASGATVTGATELSIDGAAYTIAAMRAASPKAITDINYGSSVFE